MVTSALRQHRQLSNYKLIHIDIYNSYKTSVPRPIFSNWNRWGSKAHGNIYIASTQAEDTKKVGGGYFITAKLSNCKLIHMRTHMSQLIWNPSNLPHIHAKLQRWRLHFYECSHVYTCLQEPSVVTQWIVVVVDWVLLLWTTRSSSQWLKTIPNCSPWLETISNCFPF